MEAVLPYATADLTAELSLFDQATNWKSYWASFVRPHVRGRVLEVGAGSGGSIPLLIDGVTEWLCLEPDAVLAARLAEKIAAGALPPHCRLQSATLRDLPPERRFDAILYMDVMEHLEDDAGEANRAAAHLAPGGSLIVLSPAHQFLFSPFDDAAGHFRRYSRDSLRAIIPGSLEAVKVIYLDSLGMLLSLGNRVALRSPRPNPGALRFWNDWVVPASRQIDPLFGYAVGKSVLGVWRKPA
jgi:SAM-dependent methyltransferase